MKDVGDGEVVAKGGDDKRNGSEEHGPENHDAGSAGCFREALRVGFVRRQQRQQACAKTIDAQRKGEQQGKVASECHVEESPDYFFRNYGGRQPLEKTSVVSGGHGSPGDRKAVEGA